MDKSPGPNKVAAHVLKDCLDVILGPLPDMVNCSILTSSFPAKWKAEVIPILKDGDHEVAANNRPISLLPIASKVCERIVLDRVNSYLTENKLLTSHQSGNKKISFGGDFEHTPYRQHSWSYEWQKNNCACALRPFQGLWQYKPRKTIGKIFNRWCFTFFCWMVQELFIKPLPVCQNQFHSLCMTIYLLPMVFLKVQSCRHYCFVFTWTTYHRQRPLAKLSLTWTIQSYFYYFNLVI